MIVRSGLIENRDEVSETDFRRHWLNVHGPLARIVPELRGYVQNHIVTRLPTPGAANFHRVDGMSQLIFDDIPTMVRAMDSPENRACIADIKGFLNAVTILVMRPREILPGVAPKNAVKLMSVLAGDASTSEEYARAVTVKARHGAALRAMHNVVVDRSHSVDPSVPRGEQIAVGVDEFWFEDMKTLNRSVADGLLTEFSGLLRPIAAFVVAEHRLL